MAVVKRDPQIQALARGLEILDLLLEAGGPVTGGELARRVGLHESSVSRLLQTLIRSGYVSRVAGGNVPALRMLRFSRVTGAFPMIARVRPVLERIAAEHPQHHVNLCAYGQRDVTHLVRCQTGTDTITGFSFPLHRSSAAMRHLADLPDDEALAALRGSRTRYGWAGGPQLPPDEPSALVWARQHLHHDVLVLSEWTAGAVSGAIPLGVGGDEPLLLAIGGPSGGNPDRLHLWLHDARRRVEHALTDPDYPPGPVAVPDPTDPTPDHLHPTAERELT